MKVDSKLQQVAASCQIAKLPRSCAKNRQVSKGGRIFNGWVSLRIQRCGSPLVCLVAASLAAGARPRRTTSNSQWRTGEIG
jgi:hypothetical protein